MFEQLWNWLAENERVLWTMGALSVVTFVGSLIAIPILVVNMRADYFMPGDPGETWVDRHPVPAKASVILKNVLGVLLILAGIAMLVLPGQGVLTILIGISVMNFPGKRRLEAKILSIRGVRDAIDWMRRKRGKPPLRFPDDADRERSER